MTGRHIEYANRLKVTAQISSASGRVQCSRRHGESMRVSATQGKALIDMLDRDQETLRAANATNVLEVQETGLSKCSVSKFSLLAK